jgi:hypothetical protein
MHRCQDLNTRSFYKQVYEAVNPEKRLRHGKANIHTLSSKVCYLLIRQGCKWYPYVLPLNVI